MHFHFCGRGQWVGCGLLLGELTGNVTGVRAVSPHRPQEMGLGSGDACAGHTLGHECVSAGDI